MKIGFYNAWIHTMGGGEKHSLPIAEYLSRINGNTVDILTPHKVDISQLEKRLDLDLSKIRVRYLSTNEERIIEHVTSEYDLLINASYSSSLINQAKKGILFVYFPPKLDAGLNIFKKLAVKTLGPLAKKFNSTNPIDYRDGFYPQEKEFFKYFRWTKDHALVEIDDYTNKGLEIKLSGKRPQNLDQSILKIKINKQLQNTTYKLPKHGFKIINIDRLSNVDDKRVTLEFFTNTFCPQKEKLEDDPRNLGIMIYWIREPRPKKRALTQLLQQQIPPLLLDYPKLPRFTSSYDLIIANSKYTQNWISKLWDVDSQVFYPYVDTNIFKPLPKENIILSVGRFFKVGHNKKQLDCIKAFRKMVDNGLTDWKYLLVGGVHDNRLDRQYLEQCCRKAQGYPIYIENDLPYKKLTELYGKAKIFWHAAGFRENEKRHPDKFEHFGITTVEAMSAGCVPVVIGKAGQREIVDYGHNGYLWSTLNELNDLTWQLINNDDLRKKLSKQAMTKANCFNHEKFNKNLQELVKDFL